ncbi:ACP S-malonyltransferase [Micromonospora sp. DT233]|uniref:ACP S-malonyltransferase n=1 Tax=Micromonospora sp. DT233 TaxID=3393432 RepID=UPI003CF928EE
MRAVLFPGQGSQRRGMGVDVLDQRPDLVAQADEILGYDLRELCLTDPQGRLRDTRYAQPALFVVNALSWLRWREREPEPDFLAGHSLGEYDALFAAGCFDFATGVRLVRRRGELMGRAAGGGMLAVVGLDAQRVAAVLREAGEDAVDLANHNSADQVVLSGPRERLEALVPPLRAAGGRGVPLNVSAAFHSRYMADVAREFGAFLDGVAFAPPRLPVIANVTARPYAAAEVGALLRRQVGSPVRWWDSLLHLRSRGVDEAVEVGPGRVLSGLWRAALAAPTPATPAAAPATTPTTPAAALAPAAPAPAPATVGAGEVGAESLGSREFRADYGVRYAYAAGSMYQGIASTALVRRLGRAGLIGFFGAGGLRLDEVEAALRELTDEFGPGGRFGMNLLYGLDDGDREDATVSLYLRYGVRHVEAAGYPQVTAPVVRLRFAGAHRDAAGRPVAGRHVLAKVSRPEVAEAFLRPPAEPLLRGLVAAGQLTEEEARIARELPVSGDLCVESDSGGHTDAGVALTLLPAMTRLRDEVSARYGYPVRVRVGAAGGLGAPEAVAAAFVLGADFVVTGSVNQCTPESGASAAVKDLLAGLDVADTTYAPAGDMFELGARVQVVRRGTLFAARANKLYQLYRQHESLDALGADELATVERYFGRSVDEVWKETEEYLARTRPGELARADRNPRHRMALVFRWYFVHSTRMAAAGVDGQRANYQIHCGPAMGAFNRCVAGTELADWRRRHVDVVADLLMSGAARWLTRYARR